MSPGQTEANQLRLGQEYPQPDEKEIAEYTLQLLKDQMVHMYPDGTRQLRQIHPKLNGCVKAEFIVEPNLQEDLKVGLFKEARSFPAWIRFSNGNTHPVPDWKKDIRGFAIKIMNVPGEKLDGEGNFDFILMNTKGFVSDNVGKFAQVLFAVTVPWKISNILKKIGIIFSNIPIIKAGKIKAPIKMKNPCEIPYFSTVPFRFGNESKAVKYLVEPSPLNQGKLVTDAPKSKDMIKENFVSTLNKHELWYDFKIQFQEDPVRHPIENPTVEWDSVPIKLASIRIPRQVFDTPEQNKFGDDMSFNSWHCLPEHRPLGNFNRVRRIIYKGMYKFRQDHNGVPDFEPTAADDFFKNTNL